MRTARVVLLASMLVAHVAWAEAPCFCLKDGEDNWFRGCRERPHGVAQQPTIFCDDPVGGQPKRIDPLPKGWTRVLHTADGCTPCEDTRPRGPSGPRTGDTVTGEPHDGPGVGARPSSQ